MPGGWTCSNGGRNRRTPLCVQLNANAGDAHHLGRLKVEVSAHWVEMAGGAPRLRAEGEIHADDLPLDAIGRMIARIPVEQWIEIYEASRKR